MPKKQWPNKKKFCVVITHDCDRIFKYDYFNRLKLANRFFATKEFKRSIQEYCKSIFSIPTKLLFSDPYFDSIDNWVKYEKKINAKSGFFISTFNCLNPKSSINDVLYDYSHPKIIDKICELHNLGWEIGLHSSINAFSGNNIEIEVERFFKKYKFYPDGIRAHYWSTDNFDLFKLKKVKKMGGFLYDSSLGLNELIGFRRGLCYPYKPFLPSTGEFCDIWELPVTCMDYGLDQMQKMNNDLIDPFDSMIEYISKIGGLAVLDWHSDTMRKGFLQNSTKKITNELANLSNDSDCWIATPRDVINWCNIERWN